MMIKKLLRILFAYSACLILAACATSSATPTAAFASDTPVPPDTALPPTETVTPTPAVPTGLQAGTTILYRDGSTLIYIPSSNFSMGNGSKNSQIHTVSMNSYWIQQTEVTRRSYALCVAAGNCAPLDPKFSLYINDSTHAYWPVVDINWEQAQAYCAWIGGRLPTEAEWENAARGQNANTYPWGDAEPTCDLLNFNNCVGGVNNVYTYPAGKSFYGVLDMAGNAREWVSDFFEADYYKNSPQENPKGPSRGKYHVIRGGGFDSQVDEISPSARSFLATAKTTADLGFRCAVDSPVVDPPYCESAPLAKEDVITQPVERCNVPIVQEGADAEPFKVIQCDMVRGTVVGGALQSVEASTMPAIDCKKDGGQGFICTGSGVAHSNFKVPLTACVSCPAARSIPALDCPLNYLPVYGKTYCQYSGQTIPDYCPTGSVPLNDHQCVYQQNQGVGCPIGAYFDKGLSACVTVGSVNATQCMDGYRYDFDGSCCESRRFEKQYPPCLQDEYYNLEYGCVPVSQNETGISSCVTSDIIFAYCMP